MARRELMSIPGPRGPARRDDYTVMDRVGGGLSSLRRGTANLIIGPGAENLEADQRGPAVKRALLEAFVHRRLPGNIAQRYAQARGDRQVVEFVDEKMAETQRKLEDPDLPANQKAVLRQRLDQLAQARAARTMPQAEPRERANVFKTIDVGGQPALGVYSPQGDFLGIAEGPEGQAAAPGSTRAPADRSNDSDIENARKWWMRLPAEKRALFLQLAEMPGSSLDPRLRKAMETKRYGESEADVEKWLQKWVWRKPEEEGKPKGPGLWDRAKGVIAGAEEMVFGGGEAEAAPEVEGPGPDASEEEILRHYGVEP